MIDQEPDLDTISFYLLGLRQQKIIDVLEMTLIIGIAIGELGADTWDGYLKKLFSTRGEDRRTRQNGLESSKMM